MIVTRAAHPTAFSLTVLSDVNHSRFWRSLQKPFSVRSKNELSCAIKGAPLTDEPTSTVMPELLVQKPVVPPPCKGKLRNMKPQNSSKEQLAQHKRQRAGLVTSQLLRGSPSSGQVIVDLHKQECGLAAGARHGRSGLVFDLMSQRCPSSHVPEVSSALRVRPCLYFIMGNGAISKWGKQCRMSHRLSYEDGDSRSITSALCASVRLLIMQRALA